MMEIEQKLLSKTLSLNQACSSNEWDLCLESPKTKALCHLLSHDSMWELVGIKLYLKRLQEISFKNQNLIIVSFSPMTVINYEVHVYIFSNNTDFLLAGFEFWYMYGYMCTQTYPEDCFVCQVVAQVRWLEGIQEQFQHPTRI